MFIVFVYMIYIYSGVNFKIIKTAPFLLNILHALLLNAFLWPILQTIWIRSDLRAVSPRFIIFAYVIKLFWCKSD